MSAVKTLTRQHQFVEELHGFVEISQQVSVLNMQRVRQSVLQTRSYMEGIIAIFQDVRRSHQRQVEKILASGKATSLIGPAKKKSVTILLSPSGKFSGPLIHQVFAEFEKYRKNSQTDVVVVGQTGRELAERQLKSHGKLQYFPVNLDHPDNQEISSLLNYVLQYDSITVFTGQFQSLVIQKPNAFNISGYDSLRSQTVEDAEHREFLFEPDLNRIVSFFDAQVTASLFRQSLDESKLANLGSRIMTLEASRGGINQELGRLDSRLLRARRRQDNRKQFARLSGMRMWK